MHEIASKLVRIMSNNQKIERGGESVLLIFLKIIKHFSKLNLLLDQTMSNINKKKHEQHNAHNTNILMWKIWLREKPQWETLPTIR